MKGEIWAFDLVNAGLIMKNRSSPRGDIHISEVFSCPLWEIRSFNDRRITITLSARALIMRFVSFLGATLHIKPSVECYQ